MKTCLKKFNATDPIYILLPYTVFLLVCFLHRCELGYQEIIIATLSAVIITGVRKVLLDKWTASLLSYALFITAIALFSYSIFFAESIYRMEGTLIFSLWVAVFTMPPRYQPMTNASSTKE